MLPSLSSSPDRKTSRTALLFLRSFLSTAFLALFLSRGSQRVCVCVCECEKKAQECVRIHRVCVWVAQGQWCPAAPSPTRGSLRRPAKSAAVVEGPSASGKRQYWLSHPIIAPPPPPHKSCLPLRPRSALFRRAPVAVVDGHRRGPALCDVFSDALPCHTTHRSGQEQAVPRSSTGGMSPHHPMPLGMPPTPSTCFPPPRLWVIPRLLQDCPPPPPPSALCLALTSPASCRRTLTCHSAGKALGTPRRTWGQSTARNRSGSQRARAARRPIRAPGQLRLELCRRSQCDPLCLGMRCLPLHPGALCRCTRLGPLCILRGTTGPSPAPQRSRRTGPGCSAGEWWRQGTQDLGRGERRQAAGGKGLGKGSGGCEGSGLLCAGGCALLQEWWGVPARGRYHRGGAGGGGGGLSYTAPQHAPPLPPTGRALQPTAGTTTRTSSRPSDTYWQPRPRAHKPTSNPRNRRSPTTPCHHAPYPPRPLYQSYRAL